jgi:hypothetical protein
MENVKAVYQAFLKEGKAPKDAAKLAQEKTGMSLVTGRPIRTEGKLNSKLSEFERVGYHGQYPS